MSFSSENLKTKEKNIFASKTQRVVAYIVDGIITGVISFLLYSLISLILDVPSENSWICGYLIVLLYFVICEGIILNGQTLGKKFVNIKIINIKDTKINVFSSSGRFILLTLPYYNGYISDLIAKTVGITNTSIGGLSYIVIIILLFIGNFIFIFFHPQNRGLHDIIFHSAVIETNKSISFDKIINFPKSASIISLLLFLIISGVYGYSSLTVSNGFNLKHLEDLQNKIIVHSNFKNIRIHHKKLDIKENKTMSILDIEMFIPYSKINDKNYKQNISNQISPIIKKYNNIKTDEINLIFRTEVWFGMVRYRENDFIDIK